MKVKVQNSEDARLAYERQHQIWELDDKQNITTQRLTDLNKELTDAQSDRMRKEALYEFAKAGNIDAVPQLRENNMLQELNKKRSDQYYALRGCDEPVWAELSEGAAASGAAERARRSTEQRKTQHSGSARQ